MTEIETLARGVEEDRSGEAPRKEYRAPALEKGLDILELLSSEGGPMPFPAITQRLGRSSGELFRTCYVLETRGFIEQTSDGLTLTSRMFEVGLGCPPVRNLVDLALPFMRQLAAHTRQSCHLVFPSRGDMVVVARMESPEQIGFSVRVGFRQPLYRTGSGSVLYGYQSPETRADWEAGFNPAPTQKELAEFRRRADATVKRGYALQPSNISEGITDISAPLLRGERAAAALAVPYLTPVRPAKSIDEVIEALLEAARNISRSMVISDSRP